MSKRGFAAIPLIIVVLLAIVAVSGYLLFGPKTGEPLFQTPNSIATSTPIDTSGWQTYTNSQYGFELKYPTDWKSQRAFGLPMILKIVPQTDTSHCVDNDLHNCDDLGQVFAVRTIGALDAGKNVDWRIGAGYRSSVFEKLVYENGLNVVMTAPSSGLEQTEDAILSTFKTFKSVAPSSTKSVASSTLSIISPNGGETLTIESTTTIKWNPVGDYVVSLQLQTPDAKNMTGCPGYQAGIPGHTYDCRYYLLFNDASNTGSIQWTVGKTSTGVSIPPGNYYMRVLYSEMGMEVAHYILAQGGKVDAYSDNYFTIVAK